MAKKSKKKAEVIINDPIIEEYLVKEVKVNLFDVFFGMIGDMVFGKKVKK